MKKIISLLLTIVLSLTVLAGCGNAVYDDLENFMNNEMTDVNANYESIKAEMGKWESMEEDSELEASIQDTLLPLMGDTLEKLDGITPATEEVKALKDKYTKVINSYKDGLESILAGIREQDENKVLEGNADLENGLKFLEEYNTALETLADEVDAEIEY